MGLGIESENLSTSSRYILRSMNEHNELPVHRTLTKRSRRALGGSTGNENMPSAVFTEWRNVADPTSVIFF